MGSGGVAIAALPTVICLEVPFSDGLGGSSICRYPIFFIKFIANISLNNPHIVKLWRNLSNQIIE